MKKFRLGLDYDGVVSRHPDHLRFISDRILMSGGEVWIITGRRESDREETLQRLKEMRFRFTGIQFYSGDYDWNGAKLDIETIRDIGLFKQAVITDLGIDLFLDDSLHAYNMEDWPCPTVHV